MKFVFLAGGLIGFLVAIIAGWSAGRAASSILLDAMLGAVVGGFLFRWFWSVLLRAIRETLITRRRAATVAAEVKKKP